MWEEERRMLLRGLLLRNCTKKRTIKKHHCGDSGQQSGMAHTVIEEGRFPDVYEDFSLLYVFYC